MTTHQSVTHGMKGEGDPDAEEAADLDSGDEVSSRIVAEKPVDDPLARFILSHKKLLLWTAVILGLGYYAKVQFESTYNQGMDEAAAQYSKVRAEFDTFVEADREVVKLKSEDKLAAAKDSKPEERAAKLKSSQDKRSESERRLRDVLSALADKREPYGRIAQIYRGLLASYNGDVKLLRAELQGFDAQKLAQLSQQERFVTEVATLFLARKLVDDEASYAEGRNMLKGLVEQGQTVGASAAVSLARISISDQEKAEAREVIEKFLVSHPEARDFVEKDLPR